MYVLWSNLNPNPNNLQTLSFLSHSYYYSSILSPDFQVLRFVSLKARNSRRKKNSHFKRFVGVALKLSM
jgi:hypothetical protein